MSPWGEHNAAGTMMVCTESVADACYDHLHDPIVPYLGLSCHHIQRMKVDFGTEVRPYRLTLQTGFEAKEWRLDSHRSTTRKCLLVALLMVGAMLGWATGPAMAQDRETALINRLEQQMLDAEIQRRLDEHRGQTLGEQMTFDYGASIRLGWAKLDNAQREPYGLRQYEANAYMQATIAGGHPFFGNLRFLYSDYYNSDTESDLLDPIGNRYWYEFDLANWQQATEGAKGDFDFNIRVGRQFVNWNSGLVWSNDLYAAKMRLSWDKLSIEGLVGTSARSGLYDFDISRPNYDTDTHRRAYAVRAEYELTPEISPFVSYFMQRDHNDDRLVLVNPGPGPPLIPVEYHYDSNYLSFGSNGSIGNQFLYSLEMVYENGNGLSTPFINPAGTAWIQTEESIEAWAGVLNMVYMARDDSLSRIECTLAFGTGDGDRLASANTLGGNQTGSNDRAFNSLGYINTGLALAPNITNLLMARIGGSTAIPINPKRPNDLRIGLDVFLFGKTTVGSPASVPTTNQRWIGWETDIRLDWRITSDVSFNFRYGLFIPNRGNPADTFADQVRQFVYGGISYAF